MPENKTFERRIEPVSIEFQNFRTPYSPRFDDVYFAPEKGVGESTYIYLEGSGFVETLKTDQQKFCIGEIGFGVALNFILTVQHFIAHAREDQSLTYLSVEKYPVRLEDLKTLYSRFPELKDTADLILEQYPILTPGFHTLHFLNGRIKLILMLGDALEMFSKLEVSNERIQFWYWDGFAPRKNPQAFEDKLFQELVRVSAPQAQGASFTAAGWVRRSLEAVGFEIEKRDGYAHKRECIRAVLKKNPEMDSPLPKWFSGKNLKTLNPGDRVAVIGAGLSGTAIARALAERGFACTLIDQESIAAHASGNTVGLFNLQLSRLPNPMSRYSQLSLTHFIRELKTREMLTQKGILRLDAVREPKSFDDAMTTSEYPSDFFEKRDDGMFFPECGIVNPQKVCGIRACHPQINTMIATVSEVRKNNSNFSLLDPHHQLITEAEHVIYATGSAQVRDHFLQHTLLSELPLRPIRGQVIHVKPTPDSHSLSSALVDSGYITPLAPQISGTQTHVIGATYQAKTIAENQVALDSEQLLDEARKKHPAFQSLSEQDLVSFRVGYRLSTPDKLPLIGPLCNSEHLKELYRTTLRGVKNESLESLPIEAGEWLFLGMGSRGITFSSYGAEILASLMCGEVLPIETDLWQHLHSARFFVRNLKKPQAQDQKLR